MEVHRALLGEKLAVLQADEFEGKTVKSVKQSLAAQFPGFAEYYFLILSVNPFFDSFWKLFSRLLQIIGLFYHWLNHLGNLFELCLTLFWLPQETQI